MGNEKKYSVIIRVASAIIGIGMIIIAVFMTFHVQKVRSTYNVTLAEIVKISEHISNNRHRSHSVYVSYEYDGQTYNDVHYDSYDKTMAVGKNISVYVNPANPGQIESGTYTGVLLVAAVGFVFIFAGRAVSGVFGGGSSSKQIKQLKETGLRVDAVIESTVENSKIKINGRSPFQIHCKYDDPVTGSTYCFVSNNVYGFEQNTFVPGKTIPVYVDRADYSKYFVDYSVVLNPEWHM